MWSGAHFIVSYCRWLVLCVFVICLERQFTCGVHFRFHSKPSIYSFQLHLCIIFYFTWSVHRFTFSLKGIVRCGERECFWFCCCCALYIVHSSFSFSFAISCATHVHLVIETTSLKMKFRFSREIKMCL